MSGFFKFLGFIVIVLGILYLLSTDDQKEYYKGQFMYYKNKLKCKTKKIADEAGDAVSDFADDIKDKVAE